MDQRDDRPHSKAKLEPEPDVDSHHDRGGNYRPGSFLAQLASDLWTHRLDPADFLPPLTKPLGKATGQFSSVSPEFHRCILQTEEKLIRTLLSEILNHGIAGSQLS